MKSLGTLIIGLLLVLIVAGGLYGFMGGTEQGVIETELGTIVIEFFPGDAPNHVRNFKKLARSGFYDGTTFFRAAADFVILGGDPLSKDDNPYNDGMGGPEWTLAPEFNDRKHERGIVSMARGENLNSAGSQFFICLTSIPLLDGQYTVFGRVVEGMDVVDTIAGGEKTDWNPERPRNPVAMTRVSIRSLYRIPVIGELIF